MRLLAYGGTGYYERQRIGAWDNAPRDALDDSFRLEEAQPTFGLCLIEKEPVLVVRQLQITKTGRAYAYSLLLDPGNDVWSRFEWNAAALADALFDEARGMSELLLEQPEKLNAQDLEELFDALNPKGERRTDSSVNNQLDDDGAAWVGALFTPSVSSWPSKVFGFEARPNFAETSELLWRLSPCFRAGLGWLVGGSAQSGRNFGAQFAIDDTAEMEVTRDELVSTGRRIHEALQTLSKRDDDFADRSEDLRKKPVWAWAADADKNARAIAERLTIIAALLRETDNSEALLPRAIESLPETNFMTRELRMAWQSAAFSSGKKLTPQQTSFALENLFDFQLPLGRAEMERLDENRLAEKFIEAGLRPSDSIVLSLPSAARHQVWLKLLLRTPEAEDVPGLFFSAVEDLEEERESEPYLESLYRAVHERITKDSSFNLLHWGHYSNHRLWPRVKALLREVALQRVRAARGEWQLEYLLLAEDYGGRELLQVGILQGQLRAMIRLFVKAVETHQVYAGEARRWLQALADSEIRRMNVLTYEDKLLIAQTVGGRWTDYLDLWAAYNNQVEFFKREPVQSNEEREVLLEELVELIRKRPARGFAPDISGLEMMLGRLPPQVMEYFERLSPSFSRPEDARKWVLNWRVKDPVRASKETVRYCLESDGEEFSNFWLTIEFEEKEMETLFRTLMFQQHPTRDLRYRKRLRELLTKARGNQRVLKVVRRVFKEGMEKEASEKVFCKRFANDPEALDALIRCLRKNATGIALTDALSRYDQDQFVRQASEVWRTVTYKKGPLTPYQYSLMYNLHKRRATRVKVEQVLEDSCGWRVELKLEELLQRGLDDSSFQEQMDESEEPAEESKEPRPRIEVHLDEPQSVSLFSRVKSYFGIGVARKAQEASGESSSGGRDEDFNDAADVDATREDEVFPDEPNPRDL
jgi:hypothetical protein